MAFDNTKKYLFTLRFLDSRVRGNDDTITTKVLSTTSPARLSVQIADVFLRSATLAQ